MNYLKRELAARPKPDPHVWGEDPERIRMGLLLSKKIQEVYDWPNDHFLPNDPFDIVMLIPWDDLEIVELIMSLEEDLQFEIKNTDPEAWVGATLSTVVDHLLALEKKRK